MIHAGVYSAVTHYLKAVAGAQERADGTEVVAKMKAMPTDDPLFGKGTIRADGRKIHGMYLFEVKKPAESKGPWDYYKVRATIPAAEAFRPIKEGGCPLVSGNASTLPAMQGTSGASDRLGCRAMHASPLIASQAWRGAMSPHVRNLRRPAAGAVRPAADRPDQRLVLRAAQPGAGRDLRPAQHHQFHPRRPVHDGRVRRVFPAAILRHRLLVGAAARAARRSARSAS